MKQNPLGRMFIAGTIMTALFIYGAHSQDAGSSTAPSASTAPDLRQGGPMNTNPAPSALNDDQADQKPGLKVTRSPGIDDVLQMMHAGVSTNVIKTYIENAPTHYNLSPADIITLKQEGVPDELTTAMVNRGAALAAQSSDQRKLNPLVLPYQGGGRSYGGMDPESYDYFHYYYLYPRTLAAAN